MIKIYKAIENYTNLMDHGKGKKDNDTWEVHALLLLKLKK